MISAAGAATGCDGLLLGLGFRKVADPFLGGDVLSQQILYAVENALPTRFVLFGEHQRLRVLQGAGVGIQGPRVLESAIVGIQDHGSVQDVKRKSSGFFGLRLFNLLNLILTLYFNSFDNDWDLFTGL